MDETKEFKIEILTSKSGFDLYESSNEHLEFFLSSLEDIRNKQNLIKNLIERFPDLTNDESIKDLFLQLEFYAFIIICYLDLCLISRELIISKLTWEKLFYARQTYLTIHESIISFHGHSREIKRLINLVSSSGLNLKYQELNQKIKKFKKEYSFSSDMRRIRNKTAGHIDINFENYYTTLKLIDIEKTGLMLKDFVSILGTVQKFLKDLLDEHNKILVSRKEKSDNEMRLLIDDLNKKLESQNLDTSIISELKKIFNFKTTNR